MSSSPAPLRHLIVLGHPRPGSFNHQIADTYAGIARSYHQEAEVLDLYAAGFDPLLRLDGGPATDTPEEVARLARCDALVFVYPIWFGMPPAIIKGYVDRIVGADFRPQQLKSGEAAQRMSDKRFLTLSTSAATLPWLNERGQWESLRQAFDRYLGTLFGFRSAEHVHLEAVVDGTRPDYLLELLERVKASATRLCGELARERHGRAAGAALPARKQAAEEAAPQVRER